MISLFESNLILDQKAATTKKTKKNFRFIYVVKEQKIKVKKIQLYQSSIHLAIEQINVKKINFDEFYELFKQFKINNYRIKIECERFKFNDIVDYLMFKKLFVLTTDTLWKNHLILEWIKFINFNVKNKFIWSKINI